MLRVPNSLMVAEPSTLTDHSIPTGVVLRRLTESDLPAVGEAYWRTYLRSPHEMTQAEATEDVLAAWRGEYGTWLADGSLGAWRDGEPVGAILTVSDAPWDDVPPGPFIIDLFVVPHAQRNGIGRRLVQAVLRSLRETVALRVDDTATEARALYATLGFRVLDGGTALQDLRGQHEDDADPGENQGTGRAEPQVPGRVGVLHEQ